MDNVLDIQVFNDRKIVNVLLTNDNISDELNNLLNTYREKKYIVCKTVSGTENSEDTLKKLIMSKI